MMEKLWEELSLREIAKENFDRWNKALHTWSEEVVADLYTEDNSFLPTLSWDFKKGKKGAKEYFEGFLKKNPDGKIIEDEIHELWKDFYAHTGLYNFTLDIGWEKQITQARFTYIWKKNQFGKWQIVHHHSSVKPQ